MNMRNAMSRLGLFALGLIAPLALAAEPVGITGIEVSNITPEKQVVKLTFNGDAPSPASFSINTPPRVAFDFANTTNQSGKNAVQVGGNVLRLINIAEGTNRTRVVLNLNKQAVHEAKAEGKTVLITVDGATTGLAASQPVRFSTAKPAASASAAGIQNIDFRRGDNGVGKVVVDLSSPNVGIDIRQQGKNLVVEFAKASLPATLERRLDVADFGTLVQKIDAVGQGDGAKLVIEPKGNWEYSAYQTESRFTIEVREKVDESKIPKSQKSYKGDKLSLNFQNVEVRTVLQVLAEFTGLNIITSDTVKGEITLRLKDVPWDQAMDIILQAKGLDMRKSGNVVWIAPRDELAAKEKQELESKKQIEELVATQQELFKLKYHKVEAFEKMLKDDKQKLSLLSKRGSVILDPMTNTLVVNDIPSKLEEIRALLSKLDVPTGQVMIEARIVEASDTFSRELGTKLKLGFSTGNPLSSTLLSSTSSTGSSGSYGGTTTGNNGYAGTGLSLPAANINGFGAGSLLLAAASTHALISLELSALEGEGQGKIVSSPRLVTADRVEAVIEDGQEIPYTETAPNGATTITFKKAVLSLKVKPQITPDGNIMMDVKVNKDSAAYDRMTAVGPPIDTKQVTTRVLVENGGTIVIGGIFVSQRTKQTDQIPLLGDIPVLGHLFKHKSDTNNKKELLIFITPKILQSELTLR
ncbi:type IV pilus assembly protein PilQ [Formivibrio citricus]|uniref:Type IV pilus biogenesis and competence protein PilQ n=1 Tax=Formivibrio citricus TaxID=83765 RepID=A0A1I4XR60_9NEIS|nr:type IV pilus secretin PilQ [Formivibrio citricus]SFN27770.1 type IV pilus assembly protein PilQ [Formivibrio citricus]